MVTPAQIAANRRNAAKSTGPRTPSGKYRASRNAAAHGLTADRLVLTGEDRAAFNALAAATLRDLAPVGPVEQALAERIVGLTWRLRRAEAMETAALNVLGRDTAVVGRVNHTLQPSLHPVMRNSLVQTMDAALNRKDNRRFRKAVNELKELLGDRTKLPPRTVLGCIAIEDFKDANLLDRLLRYQANLERRLDQALTQLQKLQAARRRNNVTEECHPAPRSGASCFGTKPENKGPQT